MSLNTMNSMEVVTAVLAIGSVVSPVVFGFVLWKISQVFVTKEQFEDYKANTREERADMKTRLSHIEDNTTELLQRTAGLVRRERKQME